MSSTFPDCGAQKCSAEDFRTTIKLAFGTLAMEFESVRGDGRFHYHIIAKQHLLRQLVVTIRISDLLAKIMVKVKRRAAGDGRTDQSEAERYCFLFELYSRFSDRHLSVHR